MINQLLVINALEFYISHLEEGSTKKSCIALLKQLLECKVS